MTRSEFKAFCDARAALNHWTVDYVEYAESIEAWFLDPSIIDGLQDVAQAYMVDGQDPVGME